MTKTNIYI